ncbi:MAG: hypothetical protein GTN36_01620 [Candidatus Aenigmarchaeota archaeon]|nr:hypothetical protein [Candidatus Aenigmarchaeota archaeon]
MRGSAVNLMLIVVIIVLITAVVVSWTVMNTMGFFEMNEINAVKQEFEKCNDKIIETARTALSNKCIFSAEKGEITGTINEIIYQIVSRVKVCDETPWVLINPEKNTWQKCDFSGRENIFSLKWNHTEIKFEFERMGNIEILGQTGSIVEMGRKSMSEDQINLLLRIY